MRAIHPDIFLLSIQLLLEVQLFHHAQQRDRLTAVESIYRETSISPEARLHWIRDE